MRRVLVSLVFVVSSLACGEHEGAPAASPADATPAPVSQAAATASGDEGGALVAELREIAGSSAKIEKLELQVDEAGALVKQAVYHDDASAVPEAVRGLAEQQFPGAKALRYETEHYADRGLVYEVEVETSEGQRCEVAGSPEGALIYVECQIPEAELPAPVAARAAETIPGAKLLEAERKQVEGEGESYSVELEAEGREYYLRIAADGALISKHLHLPATIELPIP